MMQTGPGDGKRRPGEGGESSDQQGSSIGDHRNPDSDHDGAFQLVWHLALQVVTDALKAGPESHTDWERVWVLTEALERLERLLRLGDIVWLNEQFELEAVRR